MHDLGICLALVLIIAVTALFIEWLFQQIRQWLNQRRLAQDSVDWRDFTNPRLGIPWGSLKSSRHMLEFYKTSLAHDEAINIDHFLSLCPKEERVWLAEHIRQVQNIISQIDALGKQYGK